MLSRVVKKPPAFTFDSELLNSINESETERRNKKAIPMTLKGALK